MSQYPGIYWRWTKWKRLKHCNTQFYILITHPNFTLHRVVMKNTILTHFPTPDWIYVWRIPSQDYDSSCFLSDVKYNRKSAMVLVADESSMVFRWTHRYPVRSNHCYNHDSCIIMFIRWYNVCSLMLILLFKMIQLRFPHLILSGDDEDANFPWHHQSVDLNIIELLWLALKTNAQTRYPPSLRIKHWNNFNRFYRKMMQCFS